MEFAIYVKIKGKWLPNGETSLNTNSVKHRIQEDTFNCEDVIIVNKITGEVF